jgi:hypothetical protein
MEDDYNYDDDDALICALSGVVPTPEEAEIAEMGDEDNDAPIEWLQVTFSRKYANPAYLEIQETKQVLIEGLLKTISEDEAVREASRRGVEIQVAAQFAALEMKPENTAILVESAVRYIAPGSHAMGLVEARNEVLEAFGFSGDSPWLERVDALEVEGAEETPSVEATENTEASDE